jgi:hypothetical protein
MADKEVLDFLADKDLNKEESDSNSGEDKSHPNPNFTADSHFIFSNQIIAYGNSNEDN